MQALGPAATRPAAELAASDRCRVPAPAGTTPPQAGRPTPLGRAGSTPIQGLGPKLPGWTGWGPRGEEGFRRELPRGRAPRGPGIWETPLSQCFPALQLKMLFGKTSSPSESGKSWIFQCLSFQSADICRHSAVPWAPGQEVHGETPAARTRTEAVHCPLTGVAPEIAASVRLWPLKY